MNDFSEAVAFRTDKSVDNDACDIWDDTALIKAYDKAIKSVRGGGTCSNEESGGAERGRNRASSVNRRKKRKHGNQKKNRKKYLWKVGDRCRAVYTEDEYIYNAVIKLIDHDTATCWVTFIGYGNEEEKDLNDLMSAGSEAASPTRPVNGDFEAGYESVEYPNHTQSPAYSGSEARGYTHNPYHHDNSWYPSHQPFIPPIPGPMHWPPHSVSHGFIPPGFPPHFPGSGYMPQGFGIPMPPVPPTIPPPPPMPLPPDAQEGDHEALHTMLMSWYMSGYHTGYYQGLKQGRSSTQTASPRTQENPKKRTAACQSRPRNSGAQSR